MNVLTEILSWSHDLPMWQRDALRRLVTKSELDDGDITELADICKDKMKLGSGREAVPLTQDHLPTTGHLVGPVKIRSISHERGVNALAENQKLDFGPALTVVYGDNAAGKSGYTRIFKTACRARGAEPILGNVLSEAAPPRPKVAIEYTVDNGPTELWLGEGEDKYVGRVSIFDRHCEAVYTTRKTDVAFRPFGLDLFDGLSRACGAVQAKLEADKRALHAALPAKPVLPLGTAAARFVAGLSAASKPEEARRLAELTQEEVERHSFLTAHFRDLKAADPAKAIRELTLRASRIQGFADRVERLERALSDGAIEQLFQARQRMREREQTSIAVRRRAFPETVLPSTGSDVWRAMWAAAKRFSEEGAYPGRPFPFLAADATCPLCQQVLDGSAILRLTQFRDFVVSSAAREFTKAAEEYNDLRLSVDDIDCSDETNLASANEIGVDDATLAADVKDMFSAAEQRRTVVLKALEEGRTAPLSLPHLRALTGRIRHFVQQINERVGQLKAGGQGEGTKALETELGELEARIILANHLDAVLREIERQQQLLYLNACIQDTRTNRITTKSTEVTKAVVTQELKKAFIDELRDLRFTHVEVELVERGGDRGNFYHQLVLTRAPNIDVHKVVSEGESRCLSIAAFFADLSTADECSAILFDDPVSSLDYKWRDRIAWRLVEEAKKRQVIVFTHDVVFLLALRRYAKDVGIEQHDQHVRRLSIGAGVCKSELPWVAMKLKGRIGHLKNLWQAAEKLFRTGKQEEYEKEAALIYGLLREAWERGLEEVLLANVVERFRPGVQTQQIANLADITADDCKGVEKGMTKCSAWLPGHDQAAAARQDIPEPDELLSDIKELETWATAIDKRRQKK